MAQAFRSSYPNRVPIGGAAEPAIDDRPHVIRCRKEGGFPWVRVRPDGRLSTVLVRPVFQEDEQP